MPKVVLEAEALEALTSESRVGLLKALLEHQQTLTQLARAIGLDKAVVHRHLQKLLHGGLVERDDGHGFTYYRLTFRGRGVVRPEANVRIVVLLGVSGTAAAVGAVALVAGLLRAPGFVTGSTGFAEASSGALPFLAVGLIALAAALAVLAYRRLHPRRTPVSPGEVAAEGTAPE
ncbi:MAG TPA: winged helix-turn-helix domain-containing protein [Thermoplasmata archaeon]|nr:winged helix-turn-helix domain-containing protein [Thermoplasmata archaeon]